MTADEKELRDDLDGRKGSEAEWKREAADVRVKANSTQVVSFRMANNEFQALSEELERSGMKMAEFMREAIALRMASGRPDVTVMGKLTEWSKFRLVRSSTMNPVPDAPPLTVAM